MNAWRKCKSNHKRFQTFLSRHFRLRISTPLLPAQGLRVSNVGNRVCQWIGEASGFLWKLLLLLLHLRQAFIVAQYGYVQEGQFACLVIEK